MRCSALILAVLASLWVAACCAQLTPWPDDLLQDATQAADALPDLHGSQPKAGVLLVPPSERLPITGGERNIDFLAIGLTRLHVDLHVLLNSGPHAQFLRAAGVSTIEPMFVTYRRDDAQKLQHAMDDFQTLIDAWHAEPRSAAARQNVLAQYHRIASMLRMDAKDGPMTPNRRVFKLAQDQSAPGTYAVIQALRLQQAMQQTHTQVCMADLNADAFACVLAKEAMQNKSLWYVQNAMPIANDTLLVEHTETVACGASVKQQRLNNFSKVHVVPNGLNMSRFFPLPYTGHVLDELHISPGSFVVGYVATFDPNKDQMTLVTAAACLKRNLPSLHVLLVGPHSTSAYGRTVRQASERLHAESYVHILGERHDIAELLRALDVFVFPSKSEGFGLALAEAMATAIPCVVSDIAPVHDLAANAVRYFKPGDADALCHILQDLYEQPAARAALGQQGRNQIDAMHLNQATMLAHFVGILDLMTHATGDPPDLGESPFGRPQVR